MLPFFTLKGDDPVTAINKPSLSATNAQNNGLPGTEDNLVVRNDPVSYKALQWPHPPLTLFCVHPLRVDEVAKGRYAQGETQTGPRTTSKRVWVLKKCHRQCALFMSKPVVAIFGHPSLGEFQLTLLQLIYKTYQTTCWYFRASGTVSYEEASAGTRRSPSAPANTAW